jgi:ZIP family zinc transporter
MVIDTSLDNVLLALSVTAAAGLATVVGSFLVFASKTPSPRLLSFGLAFAGGAMVYISLSEILPKSVTAFTHLHGDSKGFAFATIAFLSGMLLMAALDRLMPNPHEHLEEEAAVKNVSHDHLKRVGLLTAIAITAHNLPEGLATFFAMLDSPSLGIPLAFAIAIHNIPEGISIAIPVYFATNSRMTAFVACLLSGFAEPVGAALGGLFLAPYLTQDVFGGVFGAIAGVMVFLALDELLPAAKQYAKGHETVYGIIGGMAVMAASLIMFRW